MNELERFDKAIAILSLAAEGGNTSDTGMDLLGALALWLSGASPQEREELIEEVILGALRTFPYDHWKELLSSEGPKDS